MAENKVRFGMRRAFYAVMKDDGTYEDPVEMMGPESCDTSASGSNADSIYAGDSAYYTKNGGASGYELSVQFAKLGTDFLCDVCGMVKNDDGSVDEDPDGAAKRFAFGYETTGDLGGQRIWFFECTSTTPTHNAATNTDSINEDPDTATFTAVPHTFPDGSRRVTRRCEVGDAAYTDFFKSVPGASATAPGVTE